MFPSSRNVARICASGMLLLLIGCTLPFIRNIDHNPPFSAHHFRNEDMDIIWKAKPNAGGITLSGKVKNLHPYYLQDLELSTRLLNEQGRVVARATYTDFPVFIPPDKSEPFTLVFHLPKGMKADKVHFSYIYLLAAATPNFRVYQKVPYTGSFISPP